VANKIGKFVLLTYLISWVLWGSLIVLSNYGILKYGELPFMILFIIGGNGPLIASFITKKSKRNKDEYKEFIGELFKGRVNVLWYLWIIVAPLVLFTIPWTINYLSNGPTEPLLRGKIHIIIPLILVNIILGGLEEVGWRGVLLPELMKRYSKFTSTIFTSVIWSVWHLPLWFIKGTSQQNMEFLSFSLLALGLSLLLTTLYTKTKSILLCVLLHSLINSYPSIIKVEISNISGSFLAMIGYCIVIYLLFNSFNTKNKERQKSLSN